MQIPHDNVPLGILQPQTAAAWREYLSASFPELFEQRQMLWTLPEAALAIRILELEEDTPELFPYGKWASIQFMKGVVDAMILLDVKFDKSCL